MLPEESNGLLLEILHPFIDNLRYAHVLRVEFVLLQCSMEFMFSHLLWVKTMGYIRVWSLAQ